MRRLLPGLLLVLLATACSAEKPRILSVTVPGDTRDTRGPYTVQIVARGLTGDDVVQVSWSIDGGQTFYHSTAHELGGRDDLLAADIPGQAQGTSVTYYVAVRRDGQVVAFDPPADDAVDPSDGGTAGADAGPPVDCPPDAGPGPSDAGGATTVPDGGLLPADGPSCGDPPPPVGYYYSFRVLVISGACAVDSECKLGLEICAGGTCRAWNGTCEGIDSCPDGYVCDDSRDPGVCVIAARNCGDDRDCPSVEHCDLAIGECRARAACSDAEPCPAPEVCHLDIGLCYDD